jgi:hypothetical protein
MFERKFLAYILYATLLEIREEAYGRNDSRLYHLSDLLHNVPYSLLDDNSAEVEYKKLLESVEFLNIPDWLEKRMIEFKANFPDLAPNESSCPL